MSPQNIPWRPVIIGGVVGALLMAVFITAVLHGAASSEAGAPASVSASPSSPAPSPQQRPAGPVSAAPEAAAGKLPDRTVLEQRLNSQDVAALNKGVPEGSSLSLAYQVLDVETGDVLAASNADQLLVPASNTKLLTVTALLSVFDGTETFDTTVVSPAPGQRAGRAGREGPGTVIRCSHPSHPAAPRNAPRWRSWPRKPRRS